MVSVAGSVSFPTGESSSLADAKLAYTESVDTKR